MHSSDATHRSRRAATRRLNRSLVVFFRRGRVLIPYNHCESSSPFRVARNRHSGSCWQCYGLRAVKHRVGCNLSFDVGGLQFFQHDISQFEIESAELNPSVGLMVRAAMQADAAARIRTNSVAIGSS